MFIIFNQDLEFKGKSIPRVVLGNAPFLADAYFGHRTRLYNLDLLRNPNNVSKIIEKSYECGVRSINLANKENLLKAFKIACDNGVEMQSVSTIGKTEMDYVFPNYEQAKRIMFSQIMNRQRWKLPGRKTLKIWHSLITL